MAGDPFYRSKAWWKLRSQAFKRDGFKCRFCGVCVRGKGNAHADHIKRRKEFPKLAMVLSNIQTLCGTCHNSVKKRDELSPLGSNRGVKANGMPADEDNPWSNY